MAISTELRFAELKDLCLDPMNPRLGRNSTGRDVSQERILEMMRDWTLDELVVSFLESGGFWTHEALLVVSEKIYGAQRLVVVEGNRRVAALMYLRKAIDGEKVPRKIANVTKGAKPPESLFKRIPYLKADSREDIGYRPPASQKGDFHSWVLVASPQLPLWQKSSEITSGLLAPQVEPQQRTS